MLGKKQARKGKLDTSIHMERRKGKRENKIRLVATTAYVCTLLTEIHSQFFFYRVNNSQQQQKKRQKLKICPSPAMGLVVVIGFRV